MRRKTKTVGRVEPIEFTIFGEPASKANSRIFTKIGNTPRMIKSRKALSYLTGFATQCPVLDTLFEEDVHVDLDIYYASRRPDLDESAILDALQGKVYRNDRQVKSKFVRHHIDRESPRAIVRIETLASRSRTGGT